MLEDPIPHRHLQLIDSLSTNTPIMAVQGADQIILRDPALLYVKPFERRSGNIYGTGLQLLTRMSLNQLLDSIPNHGGHGKAYSQRLESPYHTDPRLTVIIIVRY